MTVTLVLYTGFRIGSLLFILGTVLVAELINQILCELPTFDVYLYFPAVVTIEHLVYKLTACRLRRLLS